MNLRSRVYRFFTLTLLVGFGFYTSFALADKSGEDRNFLSEGGRVFAERCVLCHGNYGAGDGFLPLVVADYPRTNLLSAADMNVGIELQAKVRWGGTTGEMHVNSPPWNEELSSKELEAVSAFVVELQNDPQHARRSVDMYLTSKPVDVETGRLVYQTRCASCHGMGGKGDGPMQAIVRNPSPYNLVESRMSNPAMHKIISQGGVALGRSGQMPPWKQELTHVQIDSVIKYIDQLKTLDRSTFVAGSLVPEGLIWSALVVHDLPPTL